MDSKKIGSITALLASGLVAGGILAGSMTANAADSGTASTPSATSSQAAPPVNPNPGNPSKPQRSDETLLTGTTADKVKAAAMKKYPNGTIIRLETDSDGVYEAHMTVDGSEVVVQVGKDFTVTGTQTMGAGHGGPPPAAGGSTTQG